MQCFQLTRIKANLDVALWVVSSTGAPWWVTRLYMGEARRRGP
jgi:hypothetical protein